MANLSKFRPPKRTNSETKSRLGDFGEEFRMSIARPARRAVAGGPPMGFSTAVGVFAYSRPTITIHDSLTSNLKLQTSNFKHMSPLAETFHINNNINLYLLDAIDEAHLKDISSSK